MSRCEANHQWSGSGRRAFGGCTGMQPLFRCTEEAGHDGPHSYERVQVLGPVQQLESPPLPPELGPRPETLEEMRALEARFGVEVTIAEPRSEVAARGRVRQARYVLSRPKPERDTYRRYLSMPRRGAA